jgi:hypothetical protein
MTTGREMSSKLTIHIAALTEDTSGQASPGSFTWARSDVAVASMRTMEWWGMLLQLIECSMFGQMQKTSFHAEFVTRVCITSQSLSLFCYKDNKYYYYLFFCVYNILHCLIWFLIFLYARQMKGVEMEEKRGWEKHITLLSWNVWVVKKAWFFFM